MERRQEGLEISCISNVYQLYRSSMDISDLEWMNEEAQAIIKDKLEKECFMCMGEFDGNQYCPMMMCMNQHSCCAPCMTQLLKSNKNMNCPHCSQPINRKAVTKNRLLLTIYDLVDTFKKQINRLQAEIESLRKTSRSTDTRASLLSTNPKLVKSFIFSQCNPADRQKVLNQSFDDPPTYRSLTVIGPEKRRENLMAYAQREKIEELKKIVRQDVSFDQVAKIRSGYGTIKKIECMEYFFNLRELLLYNNHIKTIQGLNNNIKLNVLSLAYNRIEKLENIGHLKELKRLSLECNKIKKSSADYMTTYDWKTLESLSISFHQDQPDNNEECLSTLFGGKSLLKWANLKTLYIYNSKGMGEEIRSVVKQFGAKRKIPVQVYWS